MKISATSWGAGLLCLMLTAPVFAAEPEEGVDSEREIPAVMADAGATTTATVEAIDMDSRVLTLRTEDDEVIELKVSEEARNLQQVEVGDRVEVTYNVAVALAISPADADTGLRERLDTITMDRTKLGEKPGGILRKTVLSKGVVVDVDPELRTVTLDGAENTITLAVGEDIDLSEINVGDKVEALYEESLAISVEPAVSAAKE